jgi:hypothetical protein
MERSVPNRAASRLFAVVVLTGVAAAACSEVGTESDAEGGLLESPTHEADSLRRSEERQDQNRGGGGAGGGY